jgi:HSP20 family protein
MTLTRRPSPFDELLSLRTAMDRIFDEPFFRPVLGTSEDAFAMPMDIRTTEDALVIEAALPGVRPEDVSISILGDTLTLTATSAVDRTDDKGGYHLREVRRGRFSRTVALPSGLKTDAAVATFEHGILRLAFPKAEQAKPRQIPVTAPAEGHATEVPATAGAGTAPTAG